MTNQQEIARIAREAREQGKTYGMLIAESHPSSTAKFTEKEKSLPKESFRKRKCAYCGKEFLIKDKKNRIFCSEKCCATKKKENYCERKHQKVPPTRLCAYCGKPFPNNNGGKRYCSITCKTLMAIARKKNAHPDGHPK